VSDADAATKTAVTFTQFIGDRVGPTEADMPTIERVVVVVKENHTFDDYFGAFPGAQGAKLLGRGRPSCGPQS
jgi:phospholipase C